MLAGPPVASPLPARPHPRRLQPPVSVGGSLVLHQCYTFDLPTRRRRHAITETPPVQAALDELRQALSDDRVDMGELVILGAHAKLARLRAEREETAGLRRRLAQRIRRRAIPADRTAADDVRRSGWARS
jgi:hypothetical protein